MATRDVTRFSLASTALVTIIVSVQRKEQPHTIYHFIVSANKVVNLHFVMVFTGRFQMTVAEIRTWIGERIEMQLILTLNTTCPIYNCSIKPHSQYRSSSSRPMVVYTEKSITVHDKLVKIVTF